MTWVGGLVVGGVCACACAGAGAGAGGDGDGDGDGWWTDAVGGHCLSLFTASSKESSGWQ